MFGLQYEKKLIGKAALMERDLRMCLKRVGRVPPLRGWFGLMEFCSTAKYSSVATRSLKIIRFNAATKSESP
jgi:hypothetical protein